MDPGFCSFLPDVAGSIQQDLKQSFITKTVRPRFVFPSRGWTTRPAFDQQRGTLGPMFPFPAPDLSAIPKHMHLMRKSVSFMSVSVITPVTDE